MKIRRAEKGDENAILGLIKGLAEYEKEPEAVINTAEQLAIDLFQDNICEAFVAESDGGIVGFALYYSSYSTWNGRCVYLEDLYVLPEHRRTGVGKDLFDAVVNIAKERRVKRLDWQVLDWNEPAIRFYEKEGATIDKEWYNGRMFFD
jgi:GNAT superfamily N-acetyltransferase